MGDGPGFVVGALGEDGALYVSDLLAPGQEEDDDEDMVGGTMDSGRKRTGRRRAGGVMGSDFYFRRHEMNDSNFYFRWHEMLGRTGSWRS